MIEEMQAIITPFFMPDCIVVVIIINKNKNLKSLLCAPVIRIITKNIKTNNKFSTT